MPLRSSQRLSAAEVNFIMKMKEVKYSNREIARRLGISEGTVRYRIKRRESTHLDKRSQKGSVLDRFKPFISRWISGYAADTRRPTYKLLYRVLRNEFALELTYDSLRRYVARHFPDFHKKPTWMRIHTPPGSLMLVDWKEDLRVRMGHPDRIAKVQALVFSLGFSGKMAIVYFTSKDLSSFISGHQQAFQKLGGLPRIIRPDCLKSAVRQWKGQNSELNFRYESYLKRLGVSVFPARPGTPTDKGQVEKRIQDFFRSIDFKHKVFKDMKDLEDFSDSELLLCESEWRSSSTGMQVSESFSFEQRHLNSLPIHFPSLPVREAYLKIRNDCTVHFCHNYYQLERKYAGKIVLCINTGTEILIYHQGQEIGRFAYLPQSRGMVMLSEKALSSPDVFISDTVRRWGLEVARRQVDYYHEIVLQGGVQ